MKDERYWPVLGTWLKDTAETPPDPRQTARRVAEFLPRTPQVRCHWWLPSLRRTPTPNGRLQVRDSHPATIAAATARYPTITGRTRSMFGPVKAITVGALVFALGGLFLVAQPFEQQDSVPASEQESAPATGETDDDAWVTGTISCTMAGEATSQEGETHDLELYPGRCYAQLSDPRVSGDWWSDVQQAWFKETGDRVLAFATTEISGPDGTWVGTATHIADYTLEPWTAPAWGIFEGTGPYDGWTFVFTTPNQLDPQSGITGIIYEGPPPPWAETLPLVPAG